MVKRSLDEIRIIIQRNRACKHDTYQGLRSDEIDRHNRAVMCGENDEEFPDSDFWARVTD